MRYLQPHSSVDELGKQIRMLVLDVDGVLTDGRLYFSEQGESLKVFNTLDGHGIKLLQQCGIEVVIISGRRSAALQLRAQNLGISRLQTGREDKWQALQELLEDDNLSVDQIACMGDDLPDLTIMCNCALAITVPNAHQSLKHHAHLCTERPGGHGAVRELADWLLQSQNQYDDIIRHYTDRSC
ncbi:KdsC family phosphatase [Pseudohongiella nitratireducens]|uniref:KdsC family phosphatase n=1 Tax=Pseudohongiella nitratireducens TaxID=1768907 RepID=UPI00240A8EC6|nr:HAD hydrolase family protein [Pseudohongiella nitratireducens]